MIQAKSLDAATVGVSPIKAYTAHCTRGGAEPITVRSECVAVEEPLQIRVRGTGPKGPLRDTLAITMRTPGDDEALAVGFLCAEGVVTAPGDIRDVDCRGNVVDVALSAAAIQTYQGVHERFARHGVMNASCGVCGKKSIAAVHVRQRLPLPGPGFVASPPMLCAMGPQVRAAQNVFDATGGIHAAALFDQEGALIALREDVGRHNALDKLIGYALLLGLLPLHRHALWVSGRTSFELVQKAAVVGSPMLVSVGAPSSLAVELARDRGLTLVGFLRGERCNVYAGEERVLLPAPLPM